MRARQVFYRGQTSEGGHSSRDGVKSTLDAKHSQGQRAEPPEELSPTVSPAVRRMWPASERMAEADRDTKQEAHDALTATVVMLMPIMMVIRGGPAQL